MAIQLMGLPQIRIQEQGLDASPVTRALQAYTAGSDKATQFANNQAVGKTAATGDLKAAARQAMGLGETDLGMQYQKSAQQDEQLLRKRLGSMAQAVEMEADPNRRQAMWQRVLKMVPGGAANLAPEEMDPMTGPKMLMAEAGIVVDPLERQQKQGALQLQQAQIGKLNREAAMGGEMPSNVREWQYFNSLSPEQRQQYITMKRADKYLDTGTSFIQPNPINPAGAPAATIQKDVAGAEIAKGEGQNIAKVRAELPDSERSFSLVGGSLDRLKATAEGLKKQPGIGNVVGGLYETYAPNVSEGARNAGTELENLKVKISGTVLQAMRDASKTGGAVGQVTEREWPRLENMIANLDPRQGKEQFLRNLDGVIAYADQVKATMKAAYDADLKTAGSRPQVPPANGGWSIERAR